MSFSLIFAGAIGNIIDSVFYGLIFSESSSGIATILPAEGGYSKLFHGRVVDMFYFPLIQGHYPSWLPGIGGKEFEFFEPVFNVADAAISVGVLTLVTFQKRLMHREPVAQPESRKEGMMIS